MNQSEIRVAIAGLGTVGMAVVRLLQEESARYREEIGVPLRLVCVLDRSYRRKKPETRSEKPEGEQTTLLDSRFSILGSLEGVHFTDSVDELLQTPADIIVELIGGADPADHIITTGLKQGKAVVTANKFLLARSIGRYFRLAYEHDAYLGFEASVAGGIPIIRVLRHSLIADRVVRLRGILNGTCNFILSEMTKSGREFQEVLTEAQRLGYAEADPTLDISGQDTTDKLAIVTSLAFGRSVHPDQIPTEGISILSPIDLLYARKLDCTIKLLGVASQNLEIGNRKLEIRNWELGIGAVSNSQFPIPNSQVLMRVSPFLIPNRLNLAPISGVINALEVTGARLGSVVFSGRGAGGDPTSVSVMADLLNAALWKMGKGRFYCPPSFHREPSDRRMQNAECGSEGSGTNPPSATRHPQWETEAYPFYIRFFVNDRPGIIAAVASVLARWDINIDSVLQEHWSDRSNLPFVMTVETTSFATMQKAMAELSHLDFNTSPPLALPILDQ